MSALRLTVCLLAHIAVPTVAMWGPHDPPPSFLQVEQAPCACQTSSAGWRSPEKRDPTCIFIDLGANDGETYKAFLNQSSKWSFNYNVKPYRHEDCRAYLVEANPGFSTQLTELKSPKVQLMTSTAAYMCDKPNQTFYVDVSGPGGWGSSLDDKHPSVSATHKGIDVNLYNLIRLLHENTLPEDTVVVKMDIEGAEYDILPCLAKSPAAELIDTLYLEDHCPGDWWCASTGEAGNSRPVFVDALRQLRLRGVIIPDNYWSPML